MNRVSRATHGHVGRKSRAAAMRDTLHRAYVNARLMSARSFKRRVRDSYSWAGAIDLLAWHRVVILQCRYG